MDCRIKESGYFIILIILESWYFVFYTAHLFSSEGNSVYITLQIYQNWRGINILVQYIIITVSFLAQ